MSEITIATLPDSSGFSPDPLTDMIGNGARKLIEQAVGPVSMKVPRVRDRKPSEDKITFAPSILPRYLRKVKSIEELLPWL